MGIFIYLYYERTEGTLGSYFQHYEAEHAEEVNKCFHSV